MSAGPNTTTTLPATRNPEEEGDVPPHPHLFLVLEAHRPLVAPVRFSLAKLDNVVIGRGPARQIETATVHRRLTVRIDDLRMSSTHARLGKLVQRWVLDDAGSKNGTFVNGARVTRAALADGDLIEAGQTFFIYREAVACDPNDPPVIDAAALSPAAPGLATVLAELDRAFQQLVPIARSTVSVILRGETGTGKEVLARTIHALSGRRGDFVAVNCGALPRELVEAELFGYRKGAHSEAKEDRPGLVRSANRGTLFLDEIGDLAAPAQAALLRVLQEKEVHPIGGTRAIPVDLRVIAATHRPLERMVTTGDFRADLWNRLAGHSLELPPLRARREDFGLLASALLTRLTPAQAARIRFHPRAAQAMLRHDWPGNVRELEKCLETAIVLAGNEGQVKVKHLSAAVQGALTGPVLEKPPPPAALPTLDPVQHSVQGRAAEDEARRQEIEVLLEQHGGSIRAVAKAMGKARMQVQRWLKRYGIDAKRFRR